MSAVRCWALSRPSAEARRATLSREGRGRSARETKFAAAELGEVEADGSFSAMRACSARRTFRATW